MIVLVVGTIAQRELGLYVAQNRYFSSFYFWVGSVPFPGGYPMMGLIFVGVVARLLAPAVWVRQKLGVNVVHLGAALMLAGGFFTATFSFEGNMVIGEGESADYISDYHATELAFIDTRAADRDQVTAFARGWLQPGEKIAHAAVPFHIEILKYFRNSTARPRSALPPEDARGFAKNFELTEAPVEVEDERNRAGILFRVSQADPGVNGIYTLLERMPVPQTLKAEGGDFIVELRRLRTPLPFRLELTKFAKKLHPGTEIPEAFRSDIILHDGELRQPVRVQMNEPLRYKGYTFYQASFIENGSQNTTVLAVVHNIGRVFPYLSGIVMCIGLLIHLVMQLPRLFRNEGATR